MQEWLKKTKTDIYIYNIIYIYTLYYTDIVLKQKQHRKHKHNNKIIYDNLYTFINQDQGSEREIDFKWRSLSPTLGISREDDRLRHDRVDLAWRRRGLGRSPNSWHKRFSAGPVDSRRKVHRVQRICLQTIMDHSLTVDLQKACCSKRSWNNMSTLVDEALL